MGDPGRDREHGHSAETRVRLVGATYDPRRDRLIWRPDFVPASVRMLLLVWALALALGACTMVQADPIALAAIGSPSSVRPAVPQGAAPQPFDDAPWRLRFTRL